MTDEFSFDYGKADTIDWRDDMQRNKLFKDICRWTESQLVLETDKPSVTLNIKRETRVWGLSVPRPIYFMTMSCHLYLNHNKLSKIKEGQILTFEILREPAILTVEFVRRAGFRKTMEEVALMPQANTQSINCMIKILPINLSAYRNVSFDDFLKKDFVVISVEYQ